MTITHALYCMYSGKYARYNPVVATALLCILWYSWQEFFRYNSGIIISSWQREKWLNKAYVHQIEAASTHVSLDYKKNNLTKFLTKFKNHACLVPHGKLLLHLGRHIELVFTVEQNRLPANISCAFNAIFHSSTGHASCLNNGTFAQEYTCFN